MIRRLAHLCLDTDNLPRLTDFYTQKLGFPIKFSFQLSTGETFGHYLDTGDSSFLEIFDRALKHRQWGGTSELRPLTRGSQLNHFCFECTDLENVRNQLVAQGLTPSPIHTGMDGSLQSWTSDPDGNPIELMQYTTHSSQLQRTPHTLVGK